MAVYFGVVYFCLYLFSSLAAYSSFKSVEVKNIQINEAGKDWVSGGTFNGGNGIAKTIFGDVMLSFPLHCTPTAQSHFNSTVFFTGFFTAIFLVPISLILFTLFKLKKIELKIIHLILLGVIVSLVSFTLTQTWLGRNKQIHQISLLKVLQPICF